MPAPKLPGGSFAGARSGLEDLCPLLGFLTKKLPGGSFAGAPGPKAAWRIFALGPVGRCAGKRSSRPLWLGTLTRDKDPPGSFDQITKRDKDPPGSFGAGKDPPGSFLVRNPNSARAGPRPRQRPKSARERFLLLRECNPRGRRRRRGEATPRRRLDSRTGGSALAPAPPTRIARSRQGGILTRTRFCVAEASNTLGGRNVRLE